MPRGRHGVRNGRYVLPELPVRVLLRRRQHRLPTADQEPRGLQRAESAGPAGEEPAH